MRALLLAAGVGSRLQPITNTLPKCLVPIHGKPLLEYWLENLSNAGVDEFLINTSYLHEQVELYVAQSPYKEKITLVHEKELLNTAGTILQNREFFQGESFLLVHADNLCICDFKDFFHKHYNREQGCKITMMLFRTDTPSQCGIVELNAQGVVEKFYEKVKNPPSNLANGAVYICENSLIDFLDSLNKKKIDFSLEVIPHYIGKIQSFINNGYHRDIGTPKSYALAQIEILEFIRLNEKYGGLKST